VLVSPGTRHLAIATAAVALLLAGCGKPDPNPIKIDNVVERTALNGAHSIETSPPAAGCGTTYTFSAVETPVDIRLTLVEHPPGGGAHECIGHIPTVNLKAPVGSRTVIDQTSGTVLRLLRTP
jgi:hypothetical protein